MEPSRAGLTAPAELAAMKRELSEAAELKNIAKEKRIFALKILLKVFLFIISISALLFLLLLSLAKRDGSSPALFGFSLSQIKNDHMSPSIPSGSVVVAQRKINGFSVKEGDVVIYTSAAGMRSAARITRKSQSSVGGEEYTAGFDNSLSFPDPVTFSGDRIDSVIIFKIPLLELM